MEEQKKEGKKEEKETETKVEGSEIASLKFKNSQIDFLLSILNFPSHGEELRNRNKFLKIVRPQAIEIENERIKILEELTPKGEDEKPKMKFDSMVNKMVYDLPKESLQTYQNKWDELMKEDYIIDILPSNKQIISSVKEMIKKTIEKRDFDLEQGEIVDQICEVFGI
jgi:hypothetical protein